MKNQSMILTLGLLLIPLVAVMNSGSAYAETVTVDQCPGASSSDNDCTFVPTEVTINIGDTVVWTNSDAATHTVTSGDIADPSAWGEIFDSGLPKPDVLYEYTFDTAGEYPYLCQLHPWMIGRVIVEAGSGKTAIDARTNAANFQIGDTVSITGSVEPVTVEQPLVIQVFNPIGSSFRFDQVKIDTLGSFSYNFKIEGNLATIGNYRIDIGYFEAKKSLTINVENARSVTTGKVEISNAGLVDAAGSSVSQVVVGQQVLVQSRVGNNQDLAQEYAYIVQIKDSDDIVLSLSWVASTINMRQSIDVGQSWSPDTPGVYTAQIFVWKSITNPIPLTSDVEELEFTVSA